MESALKYAYYDPRSPSAFAGVRAVFNEAKKKYKPLQMKDVEHWLSKQYVYTIHKPIRLRFPRNRVFARGIDSDWQADLCDMRKVKDSNKGMTHILTVIDVLSKFGWAEPLKTKTAEDTAKAFARILSTGRKPWRLFTDRGKEFLGREFQQYLKEMDIEHNVSQEAETKASVVERYNRTLKTRLWKYFTFTGTEKWTSVLPQIVSAINHTYHRSIKMRPVDVNYENQNDVWQTLYGGRRRRKKPTSFKFKVGDRVRVTEYRKAFRKGYKPTFTKRVFTVARAIARDPPVYELLFPDGQLVIGIFYEPELVRYHGDD